VVGVAVLLSGDAITRLYDRWAEPMLVFLARRTCDPEAAVDILAETFAAAFEDRAQFRGVDEEAARAWLFGIARHQLIDYFRREQARRRAVKRLGVERRALTEVEYERIEELAGSGELRAHVADVVDDLPEQQRAAVRLRVIDGRSYANVAHILGISQQAARARVSRGLRALRAMVEVGFDDEGFELRRSGDRV
jgi:RNA polymerase sigma-70 factor, ECF subfamily